MITVVSLVSTLFSTHHMTCAIFSVRTMCRYPLLVLFLSCDTIVLLYLFIFITLSLFVTFFFKKKFPIPYGSITSTAYQFVWQTSAGAVVLTDVVFWGLLVPFLSSEYFRVNLVCWIAKCYVKNLSQSKPKPWTINFVLPPQYAIFI